MIDGHIHFANSLDEKRLNRVIEEQKLNGAALQCIPKGGRGAVEADALDFQKQCKVPIYIFGGIARDIFEFPKQNLYAGLPEEIDRLMDMGCVGIKMLEGKPDVRKNHPVPDFDDRVWEPYWDKLEQEQIPLMFHVNDPEEFWDEGKVSQFAREAGWYYDETYINNEEQYRQVITVLSCHPKLNVCFPHFFFLSNHLDRLAQIMNRYPNVKIDITPGIELYYQLSDQITEAKEFFRRYQDRILYGTDIGARAVIQEGEALLSLEESDSRVSLIRKFLETDGDYIQEPDGWYVTGDAPVQMHGLGLSQAALQKIYEDNFLAFLKASKRCR